MLFCSFRCLLQTLTVQSSPFVQQPLRKYMTQIPFNLNQQNICHQNPSELSRASLTCSTFQFAAWKRSYLELAHGPDRFKIVKQHYLNMYWPYWHIFWFGAVPKSPSFFKHSNNDVYSLPLLFFKSLSIHDRKKTRKLTRDTLDTPQICASFFGMAFLPTASHLSLTFWHSSPRS